MILYFLYEIHILEKFQFLYCFFVSLKRRFLIPFDCFPFIFLKTIISVPIIFCYSKLGLTVTLICKVKKLLSCRMF